MTVVGVVGNVSHEGLDAEPDLATYEPHGKRPWSDMILLVRTGGDPLSLAGPVQAELKHEEKEILIENVTTMAGRINESVAPQRLTLVLLGGFAAALGGQVGFGAAEECRDPRLPLDIAAGDHAIPEGHCYPVDGLCRE